MDEYGDLIGAIDQGTCSSRFLIFSSKTGEPIVLHQEETEQIYPQEGLLLGCIEIEPGITPELVTARARRWVEMDASWIYKSVKTCITKAVVKLEEKNIDPKRIKCVGIANQMITFTMWDKFTGEPFHNSIVWLDSRCHREVEQALDRIPEKNKDYFRERIGQPISAIFNQCKIPWLINHDESIRKAIEEKRCMCGTVETWLLWNLTGGPNGGQFKTDPTNVAHQGLLNIHEMKFDEEVCKFFGIPLDILADIHSTSEIFGNIKNGPLKGVPISGMIGDQLGATTGQLSFKPGQSKCTYGTAACINVNTGPKAIYSTYGMMTVPLYKLGPNSPTVFCLGGVVLVAGAIVRWLRDNLGIIKNADDIEALAKTVDSTHDVYFVPALEGLMCPYWQDDARGIIIGLSNYTRKEHICRAALEAIAYQIQQILEAMKRDSGFQIPTLRVDGGMTVDDFLMQFQADIIGEDVVRPPMKETTALGAAIMAGAADGINIYKKTSDGIAVDVNFERKFDIFKPSITEDGIYNF